MEELPNKKKKKLIEFRKGLFDKKTIILSSVFLILSLVFFVSGLYIPKIDYVSFCSDYTIVPNIKEGFKNTFDVFKYSLCDKTDDLGKKAVEYVLYIFFFGLRTLLWFFSAMLFSYFIEKDLISNILILACAVFFWVLSSMIYFSVYTGWF